MHGLFGSCTGNADCSYLNVVDVVTVPGGVEELVAKAHDEDVLDHLLTQVVVDTEDLLFLPVRLEGFLEFTRALQVFSEWLLNLFQANTMHISNCILSTGWANLKGRMEVKMTYDDTSEAIPRVAVALQLLRHGNENTGGQSHIEDSVLLLLALLDLIEVGVEVDKGFILVILTRNVGAEFAEVVEQFFNLLCRNLDVGSHTLQVVFMVHLCPGISDNLDVLGEEFVAILSSSELIGYQGGYNPGLSSHIRGQRVQGTVLKLSVFRSSLSTAGIEGGGEEKGWQRQALRTVFFFARSPEAPSTTMTVLSLSSMVLQVAKSN